MVDHESIGWASWRTAAGGHCGKVEIDALCTCSTKGFSAKNSELTLSFDAGCHRLLHRLPLTAPLGEALLAGRLTAALERASAFVLTHEEAARDLRRCLQHFSLHADLILPHELHISILQKAPQAGLPTCAGPSLRQPPCLLERFTLFTDATMSS